MTVLGLIPARGGSKRCPRKNIRPLPRPDGPPLLTWAIDRAQRARTVDYVAVSSEDDEILAVAKNDGVITIKRPDDLATDEATSYSVILHALDQLEGFPPIDYVCLLQPTSPFRVSADIDMAVALAITNELPSVASREAGKAVPNGAVYVGRVDWLRDGGNWDRMHEATYMPRERSLDIDTEDDFARAERFVQGWGF